MSAMTLVFIRAHYVNGKLAHRFGDEVPPGLFPQKTVDEALDQKWLAELDSTQRRSLYKIFAPFSGCKECEHLSTKEQAFYKLEE